MKKKTLTQVIKEYLVESGDTTTHRFTRMLQISISGLRELNQDASGAPKAVFLTPNDNDVIDLPNDYIKYLIIGVCDTVTGNIQQLSVNQSLCLPRRFDDCGNITNSAISRNTDIKSQNFIGGFWTGYGDAFNRQGETLGKIYGIGGGNNRNGFFRIDEANNIIVLQSAKAIDIYMEYLADIDMVNGEHVVHTYEIESVKAWMYWKDIQRNRTYSALDKREAKVEYLLQKGLTRRRFQAFNEQDALSTIRLSYKQSVKG